MECCIRKIDITEDRSSHTGHNHGCAIQLGAGQVRSIEAYIQKLRTAHISLTKIGQSKIRLFEFGITHYGSVKAGSMQLCVIEQRRSKIGSIEAGGCAIGISQISSCKVCVPKIRFLKTFAPQVSAS
nr:hypothetical protein [Lignipirellula cremea]